MFYCSMTANHKIKSRVDSDTMISNPLIDNVLNEWNNLLLQIEYGGPSIFSDQTVIAFCIYWNILKILLVINGVSNEQVSIITPTSPLLHALFAIGLICE